MAAVAALELGAIGCGFDFGPRQARFTLPPCLETTADGFDARSWGFGGAPTLSAGAEGAWDSTDVLNPSVVRFGGRYLNLYSGFDGETWRTGLAVSDDGSAWRKHSEPVLEPQLDWEGDYIAANGAALADRERLRYWYQAGPRGGTSIGLAESKDGVVWERVTEGPVLGSGARGSWDESAVGDPYAVRCGKTFYLFYLGQNRFGVQRLGVARSDDGVHWRKSHLNPLLEPGGEGDFDAGGLGEPAVFFSDGRWRMLYTGRDSAEVRRLGWATSVDGVVWRKSGPVHAGEADWNRAVLCDPTVLIEDGRVRIWYGGGDVPSPDENLHGAIAEASAAR